MILQTGGWAVGAISTKSNACSRAFFSASYGGMIPSCSPSSPITRISRARMRSLMRVNLSAISRVLLYTREVSHKLMDYTMNQERFLEHRERGKNLEHGNTRKDTEKVFRSSRIER